MANLNTDAVRRLIMAVSDQSVGNDVARRLNVVDLLSAGVKKTVVDAIVATTADATTDFGSLKKGDLVVTIPAAAGNAVFETVSADGALNAAATVGDLYVVLRAVSVSSGSSSVVL